MRPPVSVHLNAEQIFRGGERQTLHLLEGLRERGQRVILGAPRDGELMRRARNRSIPSFPFDPRSDADFGAALRLLPRLRSARPDLIHFHSSRAHAVGALAGWLLGRRRPPTLLTRRVDFSIHRHSFLGLNRWKYASVDRIIAISRAVRDVLVADGVDPPRLRVVPSGLDPARFDGVRPLDLAGAFGLPPDHRVVVNLARCVGHKGQRDLVEAIPRVTRRVADASFLIVGDGPLRHRLEARARRLGIGDRLRFPGHREDPLAILEGADVFCMPSHMEGLGTVLLEALWAGLPVVATRTGGIPDIIRDGENGRLVPPRDPAALATALVDLLSDPARARRLAARGRPTVERGFTVDRMVEGTLSSYREVLSSRRKPSNRSTTRSRA